MRPGLVWPWVALGVMWLWWAGPWGPDEIKDEINMP